MKHYFELPDMKIAVNVTGILESKNFKCITLCGK